MEEAILPSPGDLGRDVFGGAVAIHQDRIAIGANGGEFGECRVYVYRLEQTVWVLETILTGSDVLPSDTFGTSVSLDGDTLLVGAPGHDHAPNVGGSAYVFRRVGTQWSEEAELLATDTETANFFGMRVSLEGDRCLVGRFLAAYVFQRSGGVWTQEVKLSPGEFADEFGWSVALANPLALVAAIGDNDQGTYSGSVFRFKHDGANWVKTDKLLASDGAAGQLLGYSVSMDGGYAVVGALGSGAYVFEVSTDIPAVTVWGLVVLGLTLLTAASIILRRRTCSA